ncbi:MAG: 8-oxo-dGTP diphosphatase MutT [Rhodospirillaceae bacterium]|nr:8-oxo-dGTP diphosphatase MutT [Rhodospirillaceae bacterium]
MITTSSTKIVTVVAAALIRPDGAILLTQRPDGKSMAGLWEFPGGKLKAGETPEQALVRELQEELGVSIELGDLEPLTFASHGYDSFHLLMPLYVCRAWKGNITPQENQAATWVKPDLLTNYPMPPADLPLIPLLQQGV